MDAIWYGIGIPVAAAIGYCLYTVITYDFEKPVSTRLQFTPDGMSCVRCLYKGQPICKKPDCAFIQYDYVCSFIRGAKTKIDFCVPLCSIDENRLPFINARKRNIPVRVILDGGLSREGLNGQRSINSLSNSGCSIRFGRKPGIMHHKFILIDDNLLILCTQSWTIGGFFCNYENTEITNSSDAVKAFSKEFQYLWKLFE